MTDEATVGSEGIDDDLAELMGYDKWPEDVSIAFDQALGIATLKYTKDLKNDFISIIHDAQAIETEFLARIGDSEENARQLRRIVAEFLLRAAWNKDQPFETCQRYWNDLLELGFYRIQRQCTMAWYFADCCRQHGQIELGIATLDPLIAELERLCVDPTPTNLNAEYYEYELESLRKLRARLEAERA